ncbi:MAG: hypothetical protein MJ252_25630, partial [archaeon]|nr:hypothetical protein [archaeon]
MKSETDHQRKVRGFTLIFYGGLITSILRVLGSLSENIMNSIDELKEKSNYDYTIGILCMSKLIEFLFNAILSKYCLKIEMFRHHV